MSTERVLILLAAIAVLGFACQWVAWRLRLPSILLLLLVGLAVGPGWVLFGAEAPLLDPDRLLGDLLSPLVSLSVAVILFEGGLTLDLRELRAIGGVLLRLSTIGVAVTWTLASLLAAQLVGMPLGHALLIGAILTVTGPTVVGPLLRHVRPRGDVGPLANWEGIAVDVVGATLSVLVFHSLAEGEGFGGMAAGLAKTLGVGVAVGAPGGWLLAWALRKHWIPDGLQNPAALAAGLGLYALADALQHESGLLAVTLIGIVLRNTEELPIKHIVEFKEDLRTLLISSLFLLLAARVDLHELASVGWREIAFVLALIGIVRPLSVWLSTIGSELSFSERTFLGFLAPRGIVAAAVSALFSDQLASLGGPAAAGAEHVATLTFLVIIGTVTVYGLSAAPLARRLGLAQASPQGVLIVGASEFAKGLAVTLGKLGLSAVIVDTNRSRVAAARLAGLQAFLGNALDEDAEERLPLFGVGRLLALTPNDEVNALAALQFAELFGRAECYQLRPSGASAKVRTSPSLRGRYLFEEGTIHRELERRIQDGWRVAATPLTDTFDMGAWRAHHLERALPLLVVDREGRARLYTGEDDPQASPGSTLVGLLPPAEEPPAEPAAPRPTDEPAA